ncbi:hypothetical protein [Rudaeicoccus suwonensis]|uniref:Uncharacterized protein n=1 Tax=Rudaeicoccus suwonensis TaxID=657409 RepID=A0A561EAH4_9MICO|nr:hypothetical protein [Rudaeicoccus suwonensis]TWE12606.1 hypothetical protein BKA23_1421 [Rudaeicoccus suwonensis]
MSFNDPDNRTWCQVNDGTSGVPGQRCTAGMARATADHRDDRDIGDHNDEGGAGDVIAGPTFVTPGLRVTGSRGFAQVA